MQSLNAYLICFLWSSKDWMGTLYVSIGVPWIEWLLYMPHWLEFHGLNGYCVCIFWSCRVWPITNFMGHDLAVIVMQNLLFIGSYGINTDVIHLFVLLEFWCRVHYLNTNVICLFVLFKHECYMSICVVYTQKSCTWFLCLNNAWHSCLNVWTHEIIDFARIWNEPMKLINLWWNDWYLCILLEFQGLDNYYICILWSFKGDDVSRDAKKKIVLQHITNL
jgi:hypothetical protein